MNLLSNNFSDGLREFKRIEAEEIAAFKLTTPDGTMQTQSKQVLFSWSLENSYAHISFIFSSRHFQF